MNKINDIILWMEMHQSVDEIILGYKDGQVCEFLEILKFYQEMTLNDFQKKLLQKDKTFLETVKSSQSDIRVKGQTYQMELPVVVEEKETVTGWETMEAFMGLTFDEVIEKLLQSKSSAYTVKQLKQLGKVLLQVNIKAPKKEQLKQQLVDLLSKKILNDNLKQAKW